MLQNWRIFLGLFFLFSMQANATNWNYLFCQSENASSFLEIQVNSERQLSVKSNESVFLLYQMPCQQISNSGPYVRCTDDFGSDVRQFYSFSRTESGFIDSYSNELIEEKVLYFVFQRSFENASGQYTQQKREFRFRTNECTWE